MLRRALHEPRVIIGVLLVTVAAAGGWLLKRSAEAQASKDFAACGAAQPAADCTTRVLPIDTAWSESSGNGFRRTYALSVQTSRHSSVSLNGLSATTVEPFTHQNDANVRYRGGRMTAVVAQDGTALKVPFAFTRRVFVSGALVAFAFLAGGGLLAWGFTRVNRKAVQPSDS